MRTAKSILTILISLLAWSSCTPLAAASTVLFSDDFSNGLDQWQQVRPQATAWQIRNEAAYIRIDQQFSISELVPRDDLWQSEWHNLRFELDYTPLSGTDRNISFHFQDLNNWYEFHFTANALSVVHLENGQVVWSTSRPFQLGNGHTYHLELRLHEQTITLLIDGQLVASDYDPSFAQDYGRIGLKAGTGADAPTEVKIDNVVVSEYTTANLGVPALKQTDPRWAYREYDSATAWANQPGIDAWGCALTSLTMIFRYYGIALLPDGTELTPDSFNTWLKSQPDGYIGEGLVNWQAGLRVARHSHELYGTPLLEYSKVVDNWQTALQNELEALRPAIIQLPGHFIVADGIASTDPLDFSITDPAFAHTRLSQHSEQPVSVRTFVPVSEIQPSLTVLSEPKVMVALTGSDIHATQTIDQLQTSEFQSAPFRLTELLTGTQKSFILTLTTHRFQSAGASFFAYNQLLEPITSQLLNQIIGPNGVRYLLSLDAASKTLIATPTTSFAELAQDLEQLRQQQLLPTPAANTLAEVFATAAAHGTHTNRYSQLSSIVISDQPGLGTDYIHQQLAAIE